MRLFCSVGRFYAKVDNENVLNGSVCAPPKLPELPNLAAKLRFRQQSQLIAQRQNLNTTQLPEKKYRDIVKQFLNRKQFSEFIHFLNHPAKPLKQGEMSIVHVIPPVGLGSWPLVATPSCNTRRSPYPGRAVFM